MAIFPYKRNTILAGLIILFSIAAGSYFRFKGLGKWPLAVDEYYFIKAVNNILKYGVPMYDSGGYYARGLLQQYLTALLFLLGLKSEFGSRLLPVIFNLLAIPGLYLLVKKISGKLIAVTVIFIFCFSVWEVEFARFARMYSLFQTIFIWYLFFLYRIIFERDYKVFKWLWILSFLSIFVYEGSIFLVILNFLPLFWDDDKQTFTPFATNIYKKEFYKILLSAALLIIAAKFLTTDFRNFHQHNSLPPDTFDYFRSQNSSGGLRIPELLIYTLSAYKLWLFLFLIPLIFSLITFYNIKKSEIPITTKAAFIILLILSLLNLIGLIIVMSLIFFMIGWTRPTETLNQYRQKKRGWEIVPVEILKVFFFTVLLNLIFWLVFAIRTTAWHQIFPVQNASGIAAHIKIMIKASLNYPNFYETFVLFSGVIPIISVITILLLGILAIYIFVNYNSTGINKYRFFLFLLFFLILIVDILDLTYFTTRYFFFLFPLIVILSLISINVITNFIFKNSSKLGHIAFISSVIILLILSEDFNYDHLITIDSRETNFRTHLTMAVKNHYYPRWDMRTTAQIVNKYAEPSDIIISNEQVNGFYLKKLDYMYVDYRGRLNGVSVNKGTKELWTGANLIYNDKDLIDLLLLNKNKKWLILNTERSIGYLKTDNFFTRFKKYAIYANPDSSAILYKIPGESNYQSDSYIFSKTKPLSLNIKN